MYKTSKKDFEYFKIQFLKWTNLFGIKDWEFKFKFGLESKRDDYQAYIQDYPVDRYAKVYYNPEWTFKPNRKDISKIAFHECLEVFFADIWYLNSVIMDEFKQKEVHKIIRTLENTLFEVYWNGKNKKIR